MNRLWLLMAVTWTGVFVLDATLGTTFTVSGPLVMAHLCLLVAMVTSRQGSK